MSKHLSESVCISLYSKCHGYGILSANWSQENKITNCIRLLSLKVTISSVSYNNARTVKYQIFATKRERLNTPIPLLSQIPLTDFLFYTKNVYRWFDKSLYPCFDKKKKKFRTNSSENNVAQTKTKGQSYVTKGGGRNIYNILDLKLLHFNLFLMFLI